MSFRKTTSVFVILIFFGLFSIGNSDETTNEYKCLPAIVELSGVLAVERVDGPPDYGEDPKAPKVDIYVLKLLKPINVKGDLKDLGNSMDFDEVKEIQIFNSDVKFKKYLKKKVTVKASLFERSAGAEYTDVLMTLHSIKLYVK